MDREEVSEFRQIPGSFVLSDAELAVIAKIDRAEPLNAQDTARLSRLQRLHLVDPDDFRPGRMVLTDPQQAELRLRQDLQNLIGHLLSDMRAIPGLMDQLKESGHRNREVAGRGITWLEGQDQVNDAIARAASASRSRVLAAQPDPRSPESLNNARERDRKLLTDRGVGLLTLYPESARQFDHQRDHVTHMSGHGAQFRTTAEPFFKLLVFDEDVFIPDLVDERPIQRGGWHVQHPAMVAAFAAFFMIHWSRSTPWRGEADAGAYEHTTPLQRRILNLMSKADLDQKQVATRLECSIATVNKTLAALRRDLDINTVPKLLYWWATSPENRQS